MDRFQVRRAVPDDAVRMAEILVSGNWETFTGLVPGKCLTFSVEESSRNWRKTLVENETSQEWLLLVAEDEVGQVVGYGMWGIGSRHAAFATELKVLMVDPAWQRRGVGRQLVVQGSAFYDEKGFDSMLVGVLKINPNKTFYEQLGATLVAERPYNWDGFETTELLYGWDNLEKLINLPGS